MSQKNKERIAEVFLLLCVIGICAIGVVRGQRTNDSRKAPQVIRCTPSAASVGTVLDLEGYRLGVPNSDKTRVHFVQGGADYLATLSGGEGENVNDKQGEIEHLDVNVPGGLISGLCQITVEVDGQQSAPITIEIIQWKPPEITAISPLQVQPGDEVSFEGSGFHITDDFVLIDAQGRKRQFEPAHAARYSDQTLPTDLPEGEAILYIVNRENPSDPPSRSFKLQVSSGPIPLEIWPSELMSVAPGQWLDLVVTSLKPLEGAERAEVAFQQYGQIIISPIVDHANPRVQVPSRLKPGDVILLTRTWRDNKASSWSRPEKYQLTKQPVAPSVQVIKIGSLDKPTHIYLIEGPDRPQRFEMKPGEVMILQGTFPVASVDQLQVMLEHFGSTLTLKPIALASPGMMKVVLPDDLQSGDWQISVLIPNDGVSAKLPVAMRIE